MSLDSFVAKWLPSAGAENANAQLFLIELCHALDVPPPDAATKDPTKDRYVFEYPVVFRLGGDETASGRVDLYKHGAFVLEAKQGGHATAGAPRGTARRQSPLWHLAMEKAYGQALGYARALAEPPPFVVVCDVGYCFDLYASFDRSGTYTPYPNALAHRIHLEDLAAKPEMVDRLRRLFVDPQSLDPSREHARVTRDVAERLAELATALEATHEDQKDEVARFLMRCLFTMFAEDAGLLKEQAFTQAIERFWLPSPTSFPGGVESLWRAMDRGEPWIVGGSMLRFNGGLFHGAKGLALDRAQLELLHKAARHDWSQVEPAIFGTLLERALDPKERHKLGAHFTPKAYVERLVRPTLEEPLREEWDRVRTEVRLHMEKGKTDDARKALRAFHQRLCKVRVLDPACGTGNFLYVAFQVLKQLESEVMYALEAVGAQHSLELGGEAVHPSQLLGIEVKPWAAAIAQVVLWIGYLQWHIRIKGKDTPPPVPVLSEDDTIECRDAVLDWDGAPHAPPKIGEDGRPVTRWDGTSTKTHPVTGEDVPDETKRVVVCEYPNARRAKWPEVEFVVGNPPFIGTKRMRALLGDGYVETLRRAYSDSVEDSADYVMYWWHHAAELVGSNAAVRFGFISTNSITQNFNRRVVQAHLDSQRVRLVWAIGDHPWVDSESGADVRIAMTVGTNASSPAPAARIETVIRETVDDDGVATVDLETTVASTGQINADLTVGANVASAGPLEANLGVSGFGSALHGSGFALDPDLAGDLRPSGPDVIRPYIGGRDLLQTPRERYAIDFSGMSEEAARAANPAAFQHVILHVKPERDQNRRESIRRLWWRFGWERPELRAALKGLRRYIATTETSKHRVFQFVDASILADHAIVVLALDDAAILGCLSSRIHVVWALAAGATLEDRPRYSKLQCFEPFPFPTPTPAQRARIADLAEQLDAHRKRQQAQHAELTITGMYNVLEKLRAGDPLTDKENKIHAQGLVSVLREIHDALDAAVFEAYGWPAGLTDEQILERLVALNAVRAEEEKRGLVRWLRPEYQASGAAAAPSQETLPGTEDDEAPEADAPKAKPKAAAKKAAFPRSLAERVAAVYALAAEGGSLTVASVAGRFKNAKVDDVKDILESLVAVGRLVRAKSGAETVWQPPRAESVAPPAA